MQALDLNVRSTRSTPPPIPRDACGPRPRRSNRRTASRKALQLRVDVVPVLDELGSPIASVPRRGVTLDLSTAGVLCFRVGYMPVGSVARLVLGLPDGNRNPLTCFGRVVRCDVRSRPGYAFKLVGLGQGDAARLRRVVAPNPA